MSQLMAHFLAHHCRTLIPGNEEWTGRPRAQGGEILDVEGAARALGVSTRTIYNLARKGDIPVMRVGREWRFARLNLIEWVAPTAVGQISILRYCATAA